MDESPSALIQAWLRLSQVDSWEQEQAILAGQQCALCGAPVAGGIAALHRHFPAKERAPMLLLSHRHPRRRGRKRVA